MLEENDPLMKHIDHKCWVIDIISHLKPKIITAKTLGKYGDKQKIKYNAD